MRTFKILYRMTIIGSTTYAYDCDEDEDQKHTFEEVASNFEQCADTEPLIDDAIDIEVEVEDVQELKDVPA